ncbi:MULTISPECIES: urea ABC transporter permease subunit UrtB [Marinimicrobium]|uniref:Amino acid/amide ABC transporter membrane protein 1 (HAAT family) n=1 Tax=Marinimicrobium koreense TaxID=306545 RepID=A0A3N1P0Q2_9GAMM|nr:MULTISPECIES: urea ABC transporter permease subunit UrtB [Marinimicrobium]ROQ18446.1 amino acid/amide ABC transporter membrane protein 1 (HAAT family) [Marinimicrobium koreense]
MITTGQPRTHVGQRLLHFLLPLLLCIATPALAQEENALAEQTRAVAQASLMQRDDAIDALAQVAHPRVPIVLTALLEGNLYSDDEDESRILIERPDGSLENALTGASLDAAIDTKRIPVTTRMRTQIRNILARLNLDSEDTQTRYEAVQRMIKEGIDENNIELLQARSDIEETRLVNETIETALSLYDLKSDNERVRLSAIQSLRGSLVGEARNELRRLRDDDPAPAVQEAAGEALASIQTKLEFYQFVESIFFGLSLGSVLLLAAIGLAITFGVMGVINMAHGELMMIGAYTTWVIQQLFPGQIAWSLAMAVPAAFLVAGLVGIAIERGVIRFLYGRPLETLLATFGISLILQQAARTIFSPLNRSVTLPDWMSGSMVINPALSLTYNRLYILAFGLIVFFMLMAILKRTSLGLKVRAVSQNRPMARAVGVRASWVDAMTFGLGSGVAGVAGVALSQLTNVGPNLGQAYIIDSFMVVVFGGVGNLWGTLVGAMGLGVLNKFMEPWAGAVLAKVLVLVMLILFIQKRPKGLFPQKGRAAE